jgi:hypothetical protein
LRTERKKLQNIRDKVWKTIEDIEKHRTFKKSLENREIEDNDCQ